MIPKVSHTRSKLVCHINEYDDGARTIFMLTDTYPELFDILCGGIANSSPTGWRTSSSGKMRYLWFPSNSLEDDDLEQIDDWKEHFEQYVLIGLSKHLQEHFDDELDYCMALDFNKDDPESQSRTHYGEAEYQLKYHHSLPHFGTLRGAIEEALDYLPLSESERDDLVLSSIPAVPGACNVPRKLAAAVSKSTALSYVQANLLCEKPAMKGLAVSDKIPVWQDLYECDGCLELRGDVDGQIVVVIDDLYQSGATMWCYAKYLKKRGAKHVIGLPCVKSLRDTDNQ